MGRVIFKKDGQVEFLKSVKSFSELDINQLAVLCNVSSRTFRDWAKGKYTLSSQAFDCLVKRFNIQIPKTVKIVDDYWYITKGARVGALKRLELYGPPGTPEGRRKGGINSQLARKESPEKYSLLGCKVRTIFSILEPSVEFAEAAGIILGDGGITDQDVKVTVSSLVDRPYATFIQALFKKVFKKPPTWFERKSAHVINSSIYGVGLVEELERWDFKRGNKIKNQVGFPRWIWKDLEFQKACVRGLMDTDGGCYFHKHKVNGVIYRNFGMCFSNKSLPIVQSVAKVLKSLGLKFSITSNGTRIYLYDLLEIEKYFELIGSNNPKNTQKLAIYLGEKSHRIY